MAVGHVVFPDVYGREGWDWFKGAGSRVEKEETGRCPARPYRGPAAEEARGFLLGMEGQGIMEKYRSWK